MTYDDWKLETPEDEAERFRVHARRWARRWAAHNWRDERDPDDAYDAMRDSEMEKD